MINSGQPRPLLSAATFEKRRPPSKTAVDSPLQRPSINSYVNECEACALALRSAVDSPCGCKFRLRRCEFDVANESKALDRPRPDHKKESTSRPPLRPLRIGAHVAWSSALRLRSLSTKCSGVDDVSRRQGRASVVQTRTARVVWREGADHRKSCVSIEAPVSSRIVFVSGRMLRVRAASHSAMRCSHMCSRCLQRSKTLAAQCPKKEFVEPLAEPAHQHQCDGALSAPDRSRWYVLHQPGFQAVARTRGPCF